MNDLFNQFLEYLNEVFKRQVGVLYYHGIEDDDIVEEIVEEVKEEAVKILEEVKEEAVKVLEVNEEAKVINEFFI